MGFSRLFVLTNIRFVAVYQRGEFIVIHNQLSVKNAPSR